MLFDGFYPQYFSQKKRILFIGREAWEFYDDNYLGGLYSVYRNDNPWKLNSSPFHRRMFRLAYGIICGMPEWQKIPQAREIAGDKFGEINCLSFAFMNISKLRNQSGDSAADWGLINAAHRLSTEGRNFIQEEVTILQPHIVITMNLGEKVASLGELTPIYASGQVRSHWLVNGGHRSLLIDTWHFAAPNKTDVECFYDPICDAIRQSEAVAATEHTGATSVADTK